MLISGLKISHLLSFWLSLLFTMSFSRHGQSQLKITNTDVIKAQMEVILPLRDRLFFSSKNISHKLSQNWDRSFIIIWSYLAESKHNQTFDPCQGKYQRCSRGTSMQFDQFLPATCILCLFRTYSIKYCFLKSNQCDWHK